MGSGIRDDNGEKGDFSVFCRAGVLRKMEKRSAFTFIELLIAVSIMAIIGIASISGFSRMTELQDAETTMRSVRDAIDSLDRKVARHEIVSYEAQFETGSLGFMADLDRYKKTSPTEYGFDFATGTGFVKSTNTATGTWELRFASDDTQGEYLALPASGGFQSFAFPSGLQKRRYEVSSAFEGRILNSYTVQYYTLDNPKGIAENEVRLMGIVG